MPVGRVLGCSLHKGDDDLPRFPGLARRGPIEGRRLDATRRQAVQHEVAHRGAALTDAHRLGPRQRVIFLSLNGSLKTLNSLHVHAVCGCDLLRGRTCAQESLNVAGSKSRTRGRDIHLGAVTADSAAELVRDQDRIAFTLGVGEHQGLAVGAGPEQFELNHRFLLIRHGGIVSNYAHNVA